MMHLIEELWIITDAGITLHNQRVEEKVDKDLFGGFIAALHHFTQELGEENCKKIRMGDSQLFLSACNSLYFVARSDVDVKEKKVKAYLDKIMQAFITCYEKELESFNGNVAVFKDVDKIINIKKDSDNFFGMKIDKSVSKAVLDQL